MRPTERLFAALAAITFAAIAASIGILTFGAATTEQRAATTHLNAVALTPTTTLPDGSTATSITYQYQANEYRTFTPSTAGQYTTGDTVPIVVDKKGRVRHPEGWLYGVVTATATSVATFTALTAALLLALWVTGDRPARSKGVTFTGT